MHSAHVKEPLAVKIDKSRPISRCPGKIVRNLPKTSKLSTINESTSEVGEYLPVPRGTPVHKREK